MSRRNPDAFSEKKRKKENIASMSEGSLKRVQGWKVLVMSMFWSLVLWIFMDPGLPFLDRVVDASGKRPATDH